MKPIESPTTLTAWLRAHYPKSSHTEIKQWLRFGLVSVNGERTTNGGRMINADDVIEKHDQPGVAQASTTRPLPIIFEDDDLIVIDKPHNLLTIATEGERRQTAYRMLSDALSRESDRKPIFVVHRLDRETSGLLIFARNSNAKERLQAQFRAHTAIRRYIAIVEGEIKNEQGRLEHWLAENAQHKIYISKRKEEGKLAILDYRVTRRLARATELEITLETGRRGQIRAQLAALGYPILGDEQSRQNPLHRLALHACYLAVDHPRDSRRLEFHSAAPAAFRRLK